MWTCEIPGVSALAVAFPKLGKYQISRNTSYQILLLRTNAGPGHISNHSHRINWEHHLLALIVFAVRKTLGVINECCTVSNTNTILSDHSFPHFSAASKWLVQYLIVFLNEAFFLGLVFLLEMLNVTQHTASYAMLLFYKFDCLTHVFGFVKTAFPTTHLSNARYHSSDCRGRSWNCIIPA